MTREKRLAKALELIAPPAKRRAECEHDIEKMLDWVAKGCAASTRHKAFGSKHGKASLDRYETALDDVKAAFAALDPAIKPWFTLPDGMDRELGLIRDLRKDRPPKRDAVAAKLGTMTSYNLLVWWSHKPEVSRGGKWEQLTKMLAGIKTSPFEHMRDFKKDPVYIDKIVAPNGVLYRLRRPTSHE
jgi:hypothetical protein